MPSWLIGLVKARDKDVQNILIPNWTLRSWKKKKSPSYLSYIVLSSKKFGTCFPSTCSQVGDAKLVDRLSESLGLQFERWNDKDVMDISYNCN